MMAYVFEIDTIHLIRYGIFNKNTFLQEARMAAKLLEKKFGIKDVSFNSFQIFWQKKGLFGSLMNDKCVSFIIFNQLYDFSFGILQVNNWMKSTDTDNDGKLSYKEFNRSLKEFLKITADDNDEEEKWFSRNKEKATKTKSSGL